MKKNHRQQKQDATLGVHPCPRGNRGFALVVSLTMLVLLTIIAVGLLSLSAVTLRTTTQTMAQDEAKANARLALMIAIGELQKHAGPDRAVTATSEILGNTSGTVTKPRMTGIWESWWDFDPSDAPDYQAEKTTRFRRWLVSSADATATETLGFVNSPWIGDTVELVGNRTLGPDATDSDKVIAGLVPVVTDSIISGSYAWHVSDESVKARINLYRDPNQNTTLAQKRAMLAGHRPDPTVLIGPDGNALTQLPRDYTPDEFASAMATTGKLLSLDQAELLDQAEGKIKPLRHDITPYSLGVMSDVRSGGLKQDLSSVFEMGHANANTLPAEFTNNTLYQSTHGITGVSDPKWSALAGYYNSYQSLTDPDTNPTYAMQEGADLLDPVPDNFNPAPVIAKVETIFSIIARDKDSVGWLGSPTADPNEFPYILNIIYTPVVTLHNPYNVNISFNRMNVSFQNVPVAFNFIVNGVSQSVVPDTFESMNTMNQPAYNRGDRTFTMHIAKWSDDQPMATSSSIDGLITMTPGQTLICGPVFPPGSRFHGPNDPGFDWGGGEHVDINERKSNYIKARVHDPESDETNFIQGLGYELYFTSFKRTLRSSAPNNHSWAFFLFLKPTDEFLVEFRPKRPSWYTENLHSLDTPTFSEAQADPRFDVTAQIQATSGSTFQTLAALTLDYQSDSDLKEFFGDRTYRYPPDGTLAVSVMKTAPADAEYRNQSQYVYPIASFSASARTTRGGVDETNTRVEPTDNDSYLRDGRLAGKPFLFHNPAKSDFTLDLSSGTAPGVQAYEFNFQPFLYQQDLEDSLDVDSSNRVPYLTGYQSATGIKSGSYLEIPSGPMQTLADFRRSNALTTSYQPYFMQPVGNSLLHPLMSPNQVVETNANAADYPLLDHSVLANHALYDRFYFSTFATRNSETPDVVFEQFMDGTAPLASQAFMPYLPAGKTVETAKGELYSGNKPTDDAYKTAAEYQMIRGPFNVNSTSVQAWKAVLAGLNNTDIPTLRALDGVMATNRATNPPIPPMSMPNAGAFIDGKELDPDVWNGYPELTQLQLETLAQKIVDQVRLRGPFLSMSEFVNRQIGPNSPETRKGALEAAIGEAEVNEPIEASTTDESFLAQVQIESDDISDQDIYPYRTSEMSTGNPAEGAPGWVNQGDLLRILGPAATVRGDTFVIRVYGEAQDSAGTVTARAYAEAVVQRVPEYADPTDRPSLNAYPAASAASAANKTFGRRINLVSFRWLSSNEI